MASIINSSTTIGLTATGDTSNELSIQTNGTDAITVSSGQVCTFPNDPIMGVSGLSGDIAAARITTALNATGTAPIYACRAWVKFNSQNSANLTGTYTQTGTTVTVTINNHGYITGNFAYLDFTSGSAVDGSYEITVTGLNTFTVTQASITTSGNVTDRREAISSSGNISSIADVATGSYIVNFSTPMIDVNYGISLGVGFRRGANSDDHIITINDFNFSVTENQFALRVVRRADGAAQNPDSVCASVFR